MCSKRVVPLLLVSFCLGSAPGAWADDLCAGLIQERLPHPMTPLSRPAFREAVRDPEFGATIRRITEATAETGDAVVKPLYSTVSAWNADESLLLLYHVGVGHELYDGRSYRFLRTLDIAPADIDQVYWHTADPDVLFYATGIRLVRYHVASGVKETLRSFDFCSGPVSAGGDPMFTAWDSSAIGLRCGTLVFVYDIATDSVDGPIQTSYGTPQVAPSGAVALLGDLVVDRQFNVLRRLDLANPWEHASLGRRADGRDTLNAVSFDPGPSGSGVGSLVVHHLDSGASQVIVGPATGFPYPPTTTHVSPVAYRAPGWTFVSIVGDPAGQGVLDNEIVVADTNTGRVCRAAHHRSWGRGNTQLAEPYWAEPHVVASPSGTRAIFASDWGNEASVDTYVLELPSYQPLSLGATTDATLYRTSDTLSLSLSIANLGAPGAVDLLLLLVLPDGDQVLAFTPLGFVPGRLSDLAGLAPLATGVGLEVPFEWAQEDWHRWVWTGAETPGSYALLLVGVEPGSLADGTADPLDVRAASVVSFLFWP